MRTAIATGILAGVVSAAVLAAIDCACVALEAGGFWLHLGPTIVTVSGYLLLGAVLGGLVGGLWSLVRGTDRASIIPRFRGMVFVFTFLALSGFCCLYLLDFGFGMSQRGEPRHYAMAVLLALIAALCTWIVIGLLLRLHGDRGSRVARAAITLVAILLIGILPLRWVPAGKTTSSPGPTPAGADAPNLVLLVLDTTRLDALSCYGNPRSTTPHLDRLAKEGLLFSRAYAPASWTAPTHASLFTGLYPSEHGTIQSQPQLGDGFPTVAGLLSNGGYRTCSLQCKGVMRESMGWGRGFQHSVHVNVEDKVSLLSERLYEKLVRKSETATPIIVDMAIEWLGSSDATRPFFLFVNLTDPHTKYMPREPFFSECCRSIDMSQVNLRNVHWVARNQRTLELYNQGEIDLNPAELDCVRCLYDSETHFMDQHVGRLFDRLRSLEDGRRTVAVITSDHGELLGEHGLMSHGKYLFEELISVPLLVWGTDMSGLREDLVSLVDVFPTLLELAGVPPAEDMQVSGTSLWPAGARDTLFAECWDDMVMRKAVIVDRFKYVWESTGEQFLFDIVEDPGEFRNQLADKAALTENLHVRLASRFNLSMERDEADEDALKVLKALGYIN